MRATVEALINRALNAVAPTQQAMSARQALALDPATEEAAAYAAFNPEAWASVPLALGWLCGAIGWRHG